MRPEEQGNQSIHDQADPEIDKQTEIRPESKAAVPRGRRQMWHKQKVDGVTQHHCRERDRKVSRETHSPHLDTRTTRAGFQTIGDRDENQVFTECARRSWSNRWPVVHFHGIIFLHKLSDRISLVLYRCVRLELMIRSLTFVRHTSPEKFEQLSALLRSLGFEDGLGWSDEHSKGAPFLAPVGSLELVNGRTPSEPDVLIEVRDLDTAHQLARKQFHDDVGEIEDTAWKSRIFSLRLDANSRIDFWAFNDPEKSAPKAVEGALNASGMRFGIVVSRWNSFITERLLQGAVDCLRRSGAKSSDIQIVRVPGSFEIPSAARLLAESGTVDAIITLGCLIRGETTHYEHIATEVTRGIGQSAQETGIPHSYGVLTCENLEQAIDRAGLKSGNKGWEAAITAVEMVSLKGKLKRGASDGC